MNLGNTIKELRQKMGLRQNEFAEKCELTPAYLSQIENNLREPNLSTLKAISKCLEIPLPIMFFLSLDESDIQPAKKNAYEFIAPSLKSMVSEFFMPAK